MFALEMAWGTDVIWEGSMFTSCFTDMLSMFETSEKEKQTFREKIPADCFPRLFSWASARNSPNTRLHTQTCMYKHEHTRMYFPATKNTFLLHLKKQKLGKKGMLWGRLLRTFFRVDAVWLATVPETHWKFILGTWTEERDRTKEESWFYNGCIIFGHYKIVKNLYGWICSLFHVQETQFSPQNQGSTVIPVWFSGKTDVKCHSSRSCVYFILLQPRGQLSRVDCFLASNIVLMVRLGFHMEHSVTSWSLLVSWWCLKFFWSLSFLKEICRQRTLNCFVLLNLKSWSHLDLKTTDVTISAKKKIGMRYDQCNDYNNKNN